MECLNLPSRNSSYDRFYAEVAHLVERDLAKVEVAGSSPVFRSRIPSGKRDGIFYLTAYPGGGTGRRAGLKILSAEMRVRVRFPSGVPDRKGTRSLCLSGFLFR